MGSNAEWGNHCAFGLILTIVVLKLLVLFPECTINTPHPPILYPSHYKPQGSRYLFSLVNTWLVWIAQDWSRHDHLE